MSDELRFKLVINTAGLEPGENSFTLCPDSKLVDISTGRELGVARDINLRLPMSLDEPATCTVEILLAGIEFVNEPEKRVWQVENVLRSNRAREHVCHTVAEIKEVYHKTND